MTPSDALIWIAILIVGLAVGFVVGARKARGWALRIGAKTFHGFAEDARKAPEERRREGE